MHIYGRRAQAEWTAVASMDKGFEAANEPGVPGKKVKCHEIQEKEGQGVESRVGPGCRALQPEQELRIF